MKNCIIIVLGLSLLISACGQKPIEPKLSVSTNTGSYMLQFDPQTNVVLVVTNFLKFGDRIVVMVSAKEWVVLTNTYPQHLNTNYVTFRK